METVLFIVSSARHTCRDRLEGICRCAHRYKWHVQVVERFFNPIDVRGVLDFWRPIGVIAECGSGAAELSEDVFGKLPVVWFDADSAKRRKGWYVGADNRAIGKTAASELLRLKIENFAYAAFRSPLHWASARRDAFVEAVAEAGYECSLFDPDRELPLATRRDRLTSWISKLPRPCGIFAANDYVGEELLETCHRLGLSVPRDISVISVDNDASICENADPTLSSIAPDFVGGGDLAAEMLKELIDGARERRREEQFGVMEVVHRGSTRRIVGLDPRVMRALEFIMRQASNGIGVDDVVKEMGCSRRLAQTRFQEATGHSIGAEIAEVRIQRVFDLLRKPSQSIDSIANLAGYATCAALRKAFRLRTGISMRDWRRRELAKK